MCEPQGLLLAVIKLERRRPQTWLQLREERVREHVIQEMGHPKEKFPGKQQLLIKSSLWQVMSNSPVYTSIGLEDGMWGGKKKCRAYITF